MTTRPADFATDRPNRGRKARTAETKLAPDALGAVGLATFLILVGMLISDTTVTMLITPIVLVVVIYAMARVPLRYSMMAIMFLVLTIPSPADVTPTLKWRPPFYDLAQVAIMHWNAIDRSIGALSGISISSLDICLVALLIIAVVRERTGSKVDRVGRVPTPRPLVRLAYVSLGGTAFMFLWGMVHGGSFRFSLWQINAVVYLPVVFLLFHLGLRGPKDHATLAKGFLFAAAYKSVLAIYIINNIEGPLDPNTGSTRLQYATSHQDSMLFAGAAVLVLALALERAGRRVIWLAMGLLPLIAWAIASNGRRLAWVQVALVFVVVFVLSRPSRLKRKIVRSIVFSIPLFLVYVMAGWESKYGRFFKPVQILRSVADAQSDASSFWRELENWNIIWTLKQNPVIGTGFGNGYEEFFAMPAVPYELEHYLPHNSLLGLWFLGGFVGYTCLTLLWAGGVYFAMRAYLNSSEASHRAAAVMCFATVLVYMLQCWGDLGLSTLTGVFTVAPAIAAAGKLAVVAGQWQGRPAAKDVAPSVTPAPGRAAPGRARA
jgi:O-Antigen ligase